MNIQHLKQHKWKTHFLYSNLIKDTNKKKVNQKQKKKMLLKKFFHKFSSLFF